LDESNSVKNICEAIKDILDRKNINEWEPAHYKVASLIGYERKQDEKEGRNAE